MELNPGPQEGPAKYTADSWPTQVDSWGATAVKVGWSPIANSLHCQKEFHTYFGKAVGNH